MTAICHDSHLCREFVEGIQRQFLTEWTESSVVEVTPSQAQFRWAEVISLPLCSAHAAARLQG